MAMHIKPLLYRDAGSVVSIKSAKLEGVRGVNGRPDDSLPHPHAVAAITVEFTAK